MDTNTDMGHRHGYGSSLRIGAHGHKDMTLEYIKIYTYIDMSMQTKHQTYFYNNIQQLQPIIHIYDFVKGLVLAYSTFCGVAQCILLFISKPWFEVFGRKRLVSTVLYQF